MRKYEARMIKSPSLDEIAKVIPDYEAMLITILDAILQRFERDPAYPFINTKLNIITGEDFPELPDRERDFKGKTAVYGWIQGRGLEALVGHVAWLPVCSVLTAAEKADRVSRLTNMIEDVFAQMEMLRLCNHGRVSFLMTPDGKPFVAENGLRRYYELDPEQTTAADLFYAKGMLSAASLLDDQDKLDDAADYFNLVNAAVAADKLATGNIIFDPKNPGRPAVGKRGHGPRMLTIGAHALYAEILSNDDWLRQGAALIRYILDNHVNHGQFPGLRPHDFVENIDAAGAAWRDEQGRILSDPGHSLEYIGLAAKLLLLLAERDDLSLEYRPLLDRCRESLPAALIRNFNNGFNPVGGICKAFDLAGRKTFNSDMPWWSLPETMRAAAELLCLCPDGQRAGEIRRIIADCSNAFVKNYVNPKVHLMAYQTCAADGRPVDVIPATPDADPGYHTGLCIIDFIQRIGSLANQES